MWTTDHVKFEQLAKACGSRYLAVNFISTVSRNLAKQTPGWMIESSLITWVITGERPDMSKQYETFYRINPELRELNEFLCYVQDKSIYHSVINSYQASVKNRHLVYEYINNLSEDEQARVRVLTRMIWYQQII